MPIQPVAVIANPAAGTGGFRKLANELERAADILAAGGVDPQVFVTEGPGHARDLALRAAAAGATTVVAWGGDGTVNEVASGVMGSLARLAIVPSGSGNGLARGLRIPCDPWKALEVVCGAGQRLIDVGEIDGRLFVNVAGVGLDAEIAHGFASIGRARRGLLRYARVTLRELWAYRAREYRVSSDGTPGTLVRPLMLVMANGEQYGNGARIAPAALVDDGRLDLVVVGERSALSALARVPALFAGRAAAIPGVSIRQMTSLVIEGDGPIRFHADGEPQTGGSRVEARIRPGVLRVAVPARVQPTKR